VAEAALLRPPFSPSIPGPPARAHAGRGRGESRMSPCFARRKPRARQDLRRRR
jgi:hypothetical protein